ncbi:MAG: hypothetical protein ACI4O9_00580 [Akkermansia sp.]
MRKKRHLTIEEKRDWLAEVFRDASGQYSQADRFKAMVEDTKLAELEDAAKAAAATAAAPPAPAINLELLAHLPPPLSES